MKTAIDVIGDIHGHADRLEVLLSTLGYAHRSGAWRHPDRTAIFVGDFVDRGPGQLPTLEIVRAMTEAGSARAVMGNHEFNAITWATPDPLRPGEYLRNRHGTKGEKNRQQHQAFLAEVGEDSAEHHRWIEWFMALPLWIEEPGFRVVHACWSARHVEALTPHLTADACLTPALVEKASRKGSTAFEAVETLLKGAEVELPAGQTFTDKDGHVRSSIRTQWWNPSLNTYASTYIGPPGVELPALPLPVAEVIPEPDRPTFIGHYWFDGTLEPASRRVACVDYSVAMRGRLVAYRFDGEPELTAANFVAV